MYLLDTDHFSLLQHAGGDGAHIRSRLVRAGEEVVATTIITYEEQMRGWMAVLAAAKNLDQQVEAYRRLNTHIEHFRTIPVLDFTSAAAQEYARLRSARLKVRTMDLKIAAIALVNDGTLLSRNRRDFDRVPGLRVEDWTA